MKVMIAVDKGNGVVPRLTYDAPDDSEVGDIGTVPMYDRDTAKNLILPGVIVGLESSYSGPCRVFTRVRRAGEESHE